MDTCRDLGGGSAGAHSVRRHVQVSSCATAMLSENGTPNFFPVAKLLTRTSQLLGQLPRRPLCQPRRQPLDGLKVRAVYY